MSIKTRNGIRAIHCSFCTESESSNHAEFRDCIDEWKDHGWRMFKHGDDPEWKHICPVCRKKDTAKRQQEDMDFD